MSKHSEVLETICAVSTLTLTHTPSQRHDYINSVKQNSLIHLSSLSADFSSLDFSLVFSSISSISMFSRPRPPFTFYALFSYMSNLYTKQQGVRPTVKVWMVVLFICTLQLKYAGCERGKKRWRGQGKRGRDVYVLSVKACMCICVRLSICLQFSVCVSVLFLLSPSVPSALTSKPSSNVLSNKPMIIISVLLSPPGWGSLIAVHAGEMGKEITSAFTKRSFPC